MLLKFQTHINQQFPQLKKQHVGVAISGGVDSVVLTDLMHQSHIKITLLHCNFQLRGVASNGDQAFVKRLAEQLKIPFITTEFNTSAYAEVHKTSIQVAARELRYRWFYKMKELYQLDVIATAHHLDDNLETFLINLSRGTGLEGLTGIPEINKSIIRPLLLFTKKSLLTYAESEQLEWREDASNSETKYLRNELRHNVIPAYKNTNPELLQNFQKTVNYLKQNKNLLDFFIKKKSNKLFKKDPVTNGFKISIKKLKKLESLELFLFESLKKYQFTAWVDIKNILDSQPGAKVFSKTHTLLKDREYLLLYPNPISHENEEYHINKTDDALLTSNGKFKISTKRNDNKISSQCVQIDVDKIEFPLIVRKWQQGDYFYPSGMKGKKKVSKYFKDEKFSIPEKENTWLICTKNDVIWIVGKRADRRFQIQPETTNILKITYDN